MNNPYATDKVVFHPEIIKSFIEKKSHELDPLVIHLMPQNTCNQSCSFCSYRLDNWKNSEIFDTTKHIPKNKMLEIITDLELMGTKAVEITGGGEPLIYPHIKSLLRRLSESNIEVGLVTNGVMFTDEIIELLFETDLKWIRVSVDAASEKIYTTLRKAPSSHWDKVWKNINKLVKYKDEITLGLGFVICETNYSEVDKFCEMAKNSGVDNVRLSMAFTPKLENLLNDIQIEHIKIKIENMKGYIEDEMFKIFDLFDERLNQLTYSKTQNYDYCGTKDVLCVIDGECNLYTCCTLTGSPIGLFGSVKDRHFLDIWRDTTNFRKCFDPSKNCKCVCLYEKRNMSMLNLMSKPNHVNFI